MLKKKTKPWIEKLEDDLERGYPKFLKFVREQTKVIKNWLFFYQPENKTYEMLHIFDILVIIYVAIRLANS